MWGYCENVRKCNSQQKGVDLPINIISWKKKWQIFIKKVFNASIVLLTATTFTKNMFLEHYSHLKENDIILIEHGRDLIKYDNLNSIPNPNRPIKILIPGVIGKHKGEYFIKELKSFDTKNILEFHFIGIVSKELKEIGIYHGRYNREEFAKYVSNIKPSFIGIFSLAAETFSHTLTESFSVGVPVFVSNLGALKSRIEENGGGWVIDINNPKKTYRKILEVSNNLEEYKKAKKEVDAIKIKSIEEMGKKYERIYEKLLN